MITNEKHLLYILKVNKNKLNEILTNIEKYYYSFNRIKVDKFSGKPKLTKTGEFATRQINSSTKELKEMQKNLYKFLVRKVQIPEYAYGGTKGKNNIRNARFHQGNKYIFTTDLKSFFPSISNKQVFEMFLREGCTPSIARILTKLTTRKHQVPQGIPTSTIVANLVFKPTGLKICQLAKKYRLKFSMFVDDITLSSKEDFKDLLPEIMKIITDAGFKISHNKTHYQTKDPIITGVVCHNNNLVAPKEYKKKLCLLEKEITNGNNSVKNKIRGLSTYLNNIKNS